MGNEKEICYVLQAQKQQLSTHKHSWIGGGEELTYVHTVRG